MAENSLKPWTGSDRARWLKQQTLKRSYANDVLVRVGRLEPAFFHKDLYGKLSHNPRRYPLYAVRAGTWNHNKPTILITGGVHGYETSGIMGAIRFLEQRAESYSQKFNIVVAPCVSPWGFETINRWNPDAEDPNREFRPNGKSEEAAFLMSYIDNLGFPIAFHIDVHETTNEDLITFRPNTAARDGKLYTPGTIDDGFYLIGREQYPNPGLERAIISSVESVTHIALPNQDGKIAGFQRVQHGVVRINPAQEHIGLCMCFTGAAIGSVTTEMYPDSMRTTPEICNDAQVAAITGALDYLAQQHLV